MAFSFNVELLTFVFDCQKKKVDKRIFPFWKKGVMISLLGFALYAKLIYCISKFLLKGEFYFFLIIKRFCY
jgi:hypothetical protein